MFVSSESIKTPNQSRSTELSSLATKIRQLLQIHPLRLRKKNENVEPLGKKVESLVPIMAGPKKKKNFFSRVFGGKTEKVTEVVDPKTVISKP